MSFGGDDKQYFGTGPNVLGWGMAAAFGVKLARPDQPVVAVVGDGSFCFSGPQPLWTQARYKAPVMNIVLNNNSYNNERNRIWHYGGRQFKTGRDMTCYLGSPDVDYAKARTAFGVEAEMVKEPGKLKDAIARAKARIADGRPYLLDIDTYRDGVGAASTWHPPYSVADCAGRCDRCSACSSSWRACGALRSPPRRPLTPRPVALPQGEGRDLVAVACTQCHALNPILVGREGTAGWKRHVYNMVLRGAQLSPPKPRPSSNIWRPISVPAAAARRRRDRHAAGRRRQGTGRDRCSTCHDLERVAIVKRQKRDWPSIVANMVARGAIATPEEAQQIAAYLVAQFGSD